MGAQAVRLTSIDIDNALNNNHFEVIFQPIFSLSDGALLRMESFVRWVHPGLGVLPPGAFISFFENQGRMNELTRYVVESSLEQYLNWRGTDGPGFSVNLAFADLLDDTFPAWLDELLEESGFPAELLTLECPTIPNNYPAAEAEHLFDGLKATGVRLAIEMRGRANEQLRALKPFPFAEIKTGGSAILRFARTVRGGPGLTAISELLELAQENDAMAVAVGVEDQASLEALVSLGFDAAQGNYLASIGKADGFDPSMIAKVRSALSLENATKAQLRSLAGEAQTLDAEAQADPASMGTMNEAQVDSAQSDDDAQSGAEDLEAIAAEKKRKLRLAAKRKAAKKAAAQKAAAEQAEQELAEKQHLLEEAAAREHAEENARRLQERLTQVYDEEDLAASITPALKNKPAKATEAPARPVQNEDAAPEAGLLLGGSLAQAALGRSAPAAAPSSVTEELVDEELADDDGIDAAEDALILSDAEVLDKVGAETEEPAEPAETVSETSQEAAVLDADRTGLNLSMADSVPDPAYKIEITDRSEEGDSTPDAAAEISPRDYHFVFSAQTRAPSDEAEPLSEADLKSEDEVLDEAFRHTVELDPTVHHEDPADGPFNFDSTEKYIAERLLRPKRPKSRNFLQKKYRITHFWPRSWQRKWRELRASRHQDWDNLSTGLD
ncbi:EAL domain-containing protein [Parvularcula sp. IMCC14364]|uniref:EAL domain-containing protein n=1 Tax=Parvularcula sp. IMCC14364 TaxID=3067902 RepID=UPI0027421C4E|nr:EAL domain-containing protein [Parvularcula sp. IMCC14364]